MPLFTQKLKIDIFTSKVMSVPQLLKSQRESLISLIKKETYIFVEVPSIDYSLYMVSFRDNFSLSKVELFFWPYLCVFYSKESWGCMVLFGIDYCFHWIKQFSDVLKNVIFG